MFFAAECISFPRHFLIKNRKPTLLLIYSCYTSFIAFIVNQSFLAGVARVLGNRFKSGEKIAISNGDKSGSFLKYDIEVREADKVYNLLCMLLLQHR